MITSFSKRVASALLLIVIGLLGVEAMAYAAYFVLNREPFTYTSAHQALRRTASSSTEISVNKVLQGQVKVLHPYLGYVYDATKRDFLHAGIAISDYGFPDDHNLVQKRSKDKLVIGILGGSVAWWLQSLGRDALEAELRKMPELSEKDFVFVRMALGGFKQPQQLMAYAYAVSLGGEFDVLINLDGFNEIALYSFGGPVNPFFPHEWQALASNTVAPETVIQIGTVKVLENQRSAFAALLLQSPLRYSMSLHVMWQLADNYFAKELERARENYSRARIEDNGLPYSVTGPPFEYTSAENFYARLAEGWADSSKAIHDLSRQRGTKYFHFLQPNQYVPQSKEYLSKRERNEAYSPHGEWAKHVRAGYPFLTDAGMSLARKGVHYYDMTAAFQDERETMYADSCCHLSERGNEVLGRRIGAIVAASLSKETP